MSVGSIKLCYKVDCVYLAAYSTAVAPTADLAAVQASVAARSMPIGVTPAALRSADRSGTLRLALARWRAHCREEAVTHKAKVIRTQSASHRMRCTYWSFDRVLARWRAEPRLVAGHYLRTARRAAHHPAVACAARCALLSGKGGGGCDAAPTTRGDLYPNMRLWSA